MLYSKTKPIRIEDLAAEKKWLKNHKESECDWKAPADQIHEGGYNLGINNSYDAGGVHGDLKGRVARRVVTVTCHSASSSGSNPIG